MRFSFLIALALAIDGSVAIGQQDDPPRGVEAAYNLWIVRGQNGVCATVIEDGGKWRIRPAPGYTLEAVHDDRRPSVAAAPFDAPQAAPPLAFPADPVPGKRGAK